MTKNKIKKLSITISLIMLFAPLICGAQSLPSGVSIHMLDNGLQVLLIENPALPMVGVNTVVKVGSAYETFATSGMSHMLEHLLFNGTNSRTQKQLYDDTDRIGGYNNANTSEYYTNYMMVTPADNIVNGMEIQADMLFNSTLPEAKFQKEKGIVLEEISKSLGSPAEQINRNLISILYKGHALSLPTLGTYATIQAMDRDIVYDFYKNNYVPNNMIVSVIGNFNSAEMLNDINNIYGRYPPGEVVRGISGNWSLGFDNEFLTIPNQNNIFHRFYDGEELQLQLLFKITHDQTTAFYSLLDIKLEDNSSKLEDVLTDKFGENFQSVKLQTIESPPTAYLEARLIITDNTAIDEIIESVSSYLRNNSWEFSKEKLASEAIKARTDFLKNIEKPHMFGIYNAHEFAVNGIEAVLASYSGAIYYEAAEKLQQLNIGSEPIIILQHPVKMKTETSKDAVVSEKLFESDGLSPALIVKQNAGSKLLAIHYLIGHKASLESEYGKDAAKILHECFGDRMKSDKNSRISSRFGLSITVNDNEYIPMDDIYLNPDFGYIRVEALSDDIPAVINYLNTELQNFIPSETEYQNAIKKFSKPNPMIMGRKDPAEELFKDTYKNLIYAEGQYLKNEDYPSYEQLLQFRNIYFSPSTMVISVVSSAAPETIKDEFSSFSTNENIEYEPVYFKRIKLQQEKQNIDKQAGGNRSYLFWGFSTSIEEKDKPALQALSLILSERIIFDIREKQGMAYHMKAGIEVIDDRALFYINQGTRPQNVDKLLKQYPKYFKKSMLNDITSASLQKSINMYLGRMMFRRLSSINQAYYLGYSYYFHKDIKHDKTFLDDLQNVSINNVMYVADKYLNVNNPVTVVVK